MKKRNDIFESFEFLQLDVVINSKRVSIFPIYRPEPNATSINVFFNEFSDLLEETSVLSHHIIFLEETSYSLITLYSWEKRVTLSSHYILGRNELLSHHIIFLEETSYSLITLYSWEKRVTLSSHYILGRNELLSHHIIFLGETSYSLITLYSWEKRVTLSSHYILGRNELLSHHIIFLGETSYSLITLYSFNIHLDEKNNSNSMIYSRRSTWFSMLVRLFTRVAIY